MTRHVKKTSHGDYWRLALYAIAIFAAVYLLIGGGSVRIGAAPEAKFADSSPSGLTIVPASGVSQTSYTQSYTGTYTPTQASYQSSYTPTQSSYTPTQSSYTPGQSSYIPGENSYAPGQSSYGAGQSSYAPTQSSYAPGSCWDGSDPTRTGTCPPCPLGWIDDRAGHCIAPNSPGFVGFTTTQGFHASGHLEVRPSLVRSGDPSRVYWNVTNVRDCTVRGTNGDGSSGGAWNLTSSGPAGIVTSAIGSRTDYTLFCHAVAGATPSTITETRTVNVIPRWYEPSGN